MIFSSEDCGVEGYCLGRKIPVDGAVDWLRLRVCKFHGCSLMKSFGKKIKDNRMESLFVFVGESVSLRITGVFLNKSFL